MYDYDACQQIRHLENWPMLNGLFASPTLPFLVGVLSLFYFRYTEGNLQITKEVLVMPAVH